MKIIQITATNYDVYGIDEEGNLYVYKTMEGRPYWNFIIPNTK